MPVKQMFQSGLAGVTNIMVNIKNQQFVTDFSNKMNSVSGVIVTEYRGLKANEMTELRLMLGSLNSEFRVIKNSLASITCSNLGLTDLSKHFAGPTAVVTINSSSNPGSIVKKIIGYSKDHENLKIKCGYIYGRVLLKDDIKKIADLPSREILLAQNLMMLKMPLVRLMNCLQSPATKLAVLLKRKAELDIKQ